MKLKVGIASTLKAVSCSHEMTWMFDVVNREKRGNLHSSILTHTESLHLVGPVQPFPPHRSYGRPIVGAALGDVVVVGVVRVLAGSARQ
jgi:hypothetical protein